MSSSIFRKVALERLSSPEQLDQLLRVTSPRAWLALAGFGLIVIAGLIWSVLGLIPTTANGGGILIRRGGVSDLVAAGSGQVDELLVKVGDMVAKGQVVARVRQELLQQKVTDAESRLRDLGVELADLQGSADEQIRLTERNLDQQQADLERSISTYERTIELLKERVAAEQSLLADGLITKQTLLATEETLNTTRDQLAAARLELNGLELTRLQARLDLDREIETRQAAIRERQVELRELKAQLQEDVTIVSPHDGRVLELMVDRGDVVSPGSSILSLEIVSEELMAVLFVQAASGKKVKPGMRARISPSTVKREEHGYMLGEVTWVAEFPSTSRGMERLLANVDLVSRLLEEGPPIRIDVKLIRDPDNPSGYAWSSITGPEIEISSGTMAEGSVIIREDRPISLLMPKVRKALGL